MKKRGFHYSVLFTWTEKQSEVQQFLSGVFPVNRGRVFLPMREYYRRDKKAVAIKPLFPGYLFVYSDMDRQELHDFLFAHRVKIPTFLKELGSPGVKLQGKQIGSQGGLSDLTHDESSFLDSILDEDGIQRMSAGYREGNGQIIVMEGPLLAFQNRIIRVDRHERLAYLNLKFRELDIVAGLEVKPKRYYFPDGKDVPVVLEDGTEVDLMGLKKRMMEGESVYRSLSDSGYNGCEGRRGF